MISSWCIFRCFCLNEILENVRQVYQSRGEVIREYRWSLSALKKQWYFIQHIETYSVTPLKALRETHKSHCAFTEIHKTRGADTDGVAFVQLSEICLDFMLSRADCLMALTTCFCPPYSSHLPHSLSLLLSPFLSSPPTFPIPPLSQRAVGQRRGRSSVPPRGVMGRVTWPVFTPTIAACQAVLTRTGFPPRVSFSLR